MVSQNETNMTQSITLRDYHKALTYPFDYTLKLMKINKIWKVNNFGYYITDYKFASEILRNNNFGIVPPSARIFLASQNKFLRQILTKPINILLKQNKFFSMISKWIIFSNPPYHTEMRKHLSHVFQNKMLKFYEPMIRSKTIDILEKVKSKKSLELIGEFASELSIYIIYEILGIPLKYRGLLSYYIQDLIAGIFIQSVKNVSVFLKAQIARKKIYEILDLIINAKKMQINSSNKPTDLVSALLTEMGNSQFLDISSIKSSIILIIGAGHETTINLFANSFYIYLCNMNVQKEIKSNINFVSNLIEETLRFDPPVGIVIRTAKRNINFRNIQIKKDDLITVSLFAANRDSYQFDEPHQFQLHRPNVSKHLSFGKGIHYCLGAQLAKLICNVGLKLLITHLPNLALDGNKIEKKPLEGFSQFRKLPLIQSNLLN